MLILRLFSELLPLLAFGYLIGRFNTRLSSQIAPPLINFGIPVSLMGLLLKSGMDWRLFEALAMSLLAIGLVIVAIRIFPKIRNLIGSRSLLLGSVFGNSGHFGIPVSLALLPSQALSFSIGYDLGATLLVWSLGPILLANSSFELKGIAAWTNLLRVLTSSPATKGLVGAFLVQLTPWNDQITSALWIPSRIVIVLALMIVGIRLGSFGSVNNPTIRNLFSLVGPSLLIKLMFLPALMLALAKAFGLSALMCKALVLQAATPTAISVLLLAEASGQEQNVAVSLVAWSTLISLFTVPIWYLALQSIN
ncbi:MULTISPECIES: AEC family transporter [unclassified Prochlorococcus]|uniref:AEC family transporter n=1 Tax=unclassified Prochlorococcus TaxID=2627481 RepID=UPI0005339D92|nr:MULTISPECIES: AEC family transporter [unclassified Prochlorococcus]KGG27812.1 putative AEC transporter family [Prochlorococcus sp. MIT 0701]KGG29569.1 putative AEC transporter family [Prochlorococcus sp. MIT 0702]KGG36065.1 putative AEC transporter family [Prochlorococcus sp. MIT 0703]